MIITGKFLGIKATKHLLLNEEGHIVVENNKGKHIILCDDGPTHRALNNCGIEIGDKVECVLDNFDVLLNIAKGR